MRCSTRYLLGLIVAVAPVVASAQTPSPQPSPPQTERGAPRDMPPLSRQNPKPADPAPPSAKKEAAPADQQAADAKAAPRKRTLPETPAERDKMLSDLYAHLATAADEESAKKAAEGIERIWRHSGSDTVNLLMERATKAVNDKNNDLALKLLTAVLEIAPDFTEGWNRRAYVNFTEKKLTDALGDLRRVLALDPNHFKALDGMGNILREVGEKKGALKAFKQLDDVHPFWPNLKTTIEELTRDVDGRGI